ncbi:Uncharacterised protein [Mycobacteroides abscessus subsp. massiliense]|nr:Uncharacterised protein [Mycobacteroides abscessus subsp. massiliense]
MVYALPLRTVDAVLLLSAHVVHHILASLHGQFELHALLLTLLQSYNIYMLCLPLIAVELVDYRFLHVQIDDKVQNLYLYRRIHPNPNLTILDYRIVKIHHLLNYVYYLYLLCEQQNHHYNV